MRHRVREAPASSRLSRREFFAASAAVAQVRADRGFELRQTPGSVTLCSPRGSWTAETRNFSGAAKLSIEDEPGQLKIVLQGATFFGTNLSADFECCVYTGVTGWRVSLKTPFAEREG